MSSPASDHNLLIGIPALGERRSCLTPLPVRSPTDRRARHFSQEGHQFTAKGPSPAEATGGAAAPQARTCNPECRAAARRWRRRRASRQDRPTMPGREKRRVQDRRSQSRHAAHRYSALALAALPAASDMSRRRAALNCAVHQSQTINPCSVDHVCPVRGDKLGDQFHCHRSRAH